CLSVSIMNFLARTSQVKLIPKTIPTMVQIADKPVKNVNPVKPNINHDDSLVARSEKASAHPGNRFPPNMNSDRFIFRLLKNRPTPTISQKYNTISIIKTVCNVSPSIFIDDRIKNISDQGVPVCTHDPTKVCFLMHPPLHEDNEMIIQINKLI